MSDEIRPFSFAASDAELAQLKRRIALSRWPEKETVADRSQGEPLAELRDLVDYWQNGYDWRPCEARLNALPQYLTEIDGLDIHFIHVRSSHEQARPLILTHGWPGSVLEFLKTIPALTQPEAHGGRAEDAFHVVIPSLPGFGFSGKPASTGWNLERIGRAWSTLMARLGYDRWFAQGGDWGGLMTGRIASLPVPGCAGVHLNLIPGFPLPEDLENPSPAAQRALKRGQEHQQWGMGYSTLQQTRPQTIGYSLVDSPVGLAGWIMEKIAEWTDNQGSPYDALSRDEILDNITLYWLTATGASSARIYWEVNQSGYYQNAMFAPTLLPTAYTLFPREMAPTPPEWLRHHTNLVYANEVDRGGHFAAWEQPELFVEEVRAAFGRMSLTGDAQ